MDRATVFDDIRLRQDELPERGMYFIEVDVGDEPIYARIDAASGNMT
jgi:hypothetical protein